MFFELQANLRAAVHCLKGNKVNDAGSDKTTGKATAVGWQLQLSYMDTDASRHND